jgi:hypothetical protein
MKHRSIVMSPRANTRIWNRNTIYLLPKNEIKYLPASDKRDGHTFWRFARTSP